MWISKKRFKELNYEAKCHRMMLHINRYNPTPDLLIDMEQKAKILELRELAETRQHIIDDAITFPDKVAFSNVKAGTTAQFLNNHPDKDIISGEKCAVVMRAKKGINMPVRYDPDVHVFNYLVADLVFPSKMRSGGWYIVERNGRLETWEAKELRIIEPKPKKKAKKGKKK